MHLVGQGDADGPPASADEQGPEEPVLPENEGGGEDADGTGENPGQDPLM